MLAGFLFVTTENGIFTVMKDSSKTLVVCTAGQHRSPTARSILEKQHGITARSAGIHPQAQTSVTQAMIDWADYIIAMDERTDGHKTYLEKNFSVGDTPVYVFDIPDQYQKDDPDLVSLLEEKLAVFAQRVNNAEGK